MTQPSQSAPQNLSESSPQDMAEISEDGLLDESTESLEDQPQVPPEAPPMESTAQASEPPPSYVKLAMRNMVKKGSKSLFHFALTTVGLISLFVGLAYLTR
ncbi:MAG: DUF3285 domain-containing protein [Elainellaceae cyanobacterium]